MTITDDRIAIAAHTTGVAVALNLAKPFDWAWHFGILRNRTYADDSTFSSKYDISLIYGNSLS